MTALPAGVYAKGPREDFAKGFELAGEVQPVEFQTDKAIVKICACNSCGRPIAVNVFYAPAIARCRACSGESADAGVGQSEIVQAGRTDPEKAARLEDCLINKAFAYAVCPFDPEHEMELKSVTHNQNYGPSRLIGHDAKGPIYKNDVGETVMHQCNECKTSVSYATTHQMVYRRQNEPKPNAGAAPAYEYLLGPREQVEVPGP